MPQLSTRLYALSTRLALFFLAALVLTSCSLIPQAQKEDEDTSIAASDSQLDAVATGHAVVYLKGLDLVLMRVDEGVETVLTQLSSDQLPNNLTLDTFQIDTSHSFITWHAPNQGLLALDVASKSIFMVAETSLWFNNNPFWAFHPTQPIVFWIDDEGEVLNSYRFIDQVQDSIIIPFPYGSFFEISDDASKIVFISAFGQDSDFPTYLITDILGDNAVKFATQTPLQQRRMIEWSQDGTRLITFHNRNQLVSYTLESLDFPEVIYEFDPNIQIVNFKRIGHLFSVITSDGATTVLTVDGLVVQQFPGTTLSGLNTPFVLPIHPEIILIEESIRSEAIEFNRLWKSGLLGNREMLVPRYHDTSIVVESPTF